jgi:hypothetical protein
LFNSSVCFASLCFPSFFFAVLCFALLCLTLLGLALLWFCFALILYRLCLRKPKRYTTSSISSFVDAAFTASTQFRFRHLSASSMRCSAVQTRDSTVLLCATRRRKRSRLFSRRARSSSSSSRTSRSCRRARV